MGSEVSNFPEISGRSPKCRRLVRFCEQRLINFFCQRGRIQQFTCERSYGQRLAPFAYCGPCVIPQAASRSFRLQEV